MVLLRYLASIFVNVFGITQPSVEARDRAARYIALLTLGLIIAPILIFLLAAHMLSK